MPDAAGGAEHSAAPSCGRGRLTPAEGSALFAALFDVSGESTRGGFAAVLRATRRSDGAGVALKLVSPATEAAATAAAREASLLRRLRHDNVLPCLDVLPLHPATDGALPRLCLVLALADTDLTRHLAAGWRDSTYVHAEDPDALLRICAGVAAGLAYLHAHRVAHRDLKAANVLLRRGVPQLADLGSAICEGPSLGDLASSSDAAHGNAPAADTHGYRAPELLELGERVREVDAFAADCWALGIVLAEVATGHVARRFPGGDPACAGPRVRDALAAAAAQNCPAIGHVVAALLRHAPGRRMRARVAAAALAAPEPPEPLDYGSSSEDEEDKQVYITDERIAAQRSLLKHASAVRRKQAAAAVGGMMPTYASFFRADLVSLMSGDADASVRLAAAQALERQGTHTDGVATSAAAATLLERRTADDVPLRLAAVGILGRGCGADAWRAARSVYFADVPTALAIAACDALLSTLREDPAPAVRAAAAKALFAVAGGSRPCDYKLNEAQRQMLSSAFAPDAEPDRAVQRKLYKYAWQVLCGGPTLEL